MADIMQNLLKAQNAENEVEDLKMYLNAMVDLINMANQP